MLWLVVGKQSGTAKNVSLNGREQIFDELGHQKKELEIDAVLNATNGKGEFQSIYI